MKNGIKGIKVAIFLLCSLLISQNIFAGTKTVEFKTHIATDATPAVLAEVLKAQETEKAVEFIFEKGTYHFYPEKGLEKFCYISNHADVMVRTAFPLMGMKDVTVDGQGSMFIFHGIMIPFLVDKSKNITIKNVSIDWDVPFHSEGVIVAADEKNKTFDMTISKDYPYEIRNDELRFIKEGYEHGIGQTIMYNPERTAISFNTEAYTPLTTSTKSKVQRGVNAIKYIYETDPRDVFFKNIGREQKLKSIEIKPGLVRVFNHSKKMPPIGHVLTMKGEQGLNRVAPAFRVTHTYNFLASNVNVHHAGGMGIIAENSGDLTLDNFNITPSHGRMVSTTADATHFVGCRGKVTLKNCTLQNQLDDASNIHGTYQKIIDVLDEHRLGVYMGHHQQLNFSIGNDGDKIGLVRLSESFFPYGELSIKNTKKINSRYHIITFNEKLPKGIVVGDLLENLDAYPEVLIENCTISRNRARGLLLSSPRKTVVKNNYFHTEMEAILIPVESGYWYESGNASNLTITGNTFEDCQHSGFNRGVIRFDTDDDNENIAFNDVKITNNVFNHFDNLILQITNADGVVFKGNTIKNSGNFPQLFPENPAVFINASKNVVVGNNDYKGKAKNFRAEGAPQKTKKH